MVYCILTVVKPPILGVMVNDAIKDTHNLTYALPIFEFEHRHWPGVNKLPLWANVGHGGAICITTSTNGVKLPH